MDIWHLEAFSPYPYQYQHRPRHRRGRWRCELALPHSTFREELQQKRYSGSRNMNFLVKKYSNTFWRLPGYEAFLYLGVKALRRAADIVGVSNNPGDYLHLLRPHPPSTEVSINTNNPQHPPLGYDLARSCNLSATCPLWIYFTWRKSCSTSCHH